MCWSADVSLRFALFDTLCVALLLAKTQSRSKNSLFSGTYAAMMTAVALQEWAQYFVWKRLEIGSMDCNSKTMFFSILSTAAAETVPLPLLVTSLLYGDCTNLYANRMRRLSTWVWSFQLFIVMTCVVKANETNHYCVYEGLNHHQVWLCESATYAVGGHMMQYSFYWLYVLACVLSAEAMTGIMTLGEIRRMQTIGLASACICFALYGETLEACSVWCWSAFVLGICLCGQVYMGA